MERARVIFTKSEENGGLQMSHKIENMAERIEIRILARAILATRTRQLNYRVNRS